MSLETKPLSGSLGAEILGVDLARLEAPEFGQIREAFLEHHVLVFRDQKLTPEQQIEFGRLWGELFIHPIVPHLPDYPEIVPIVNSGKRKSLTEIWHSDVSFSAKPPMASGLLAVTLPSYGGDTIFANQHKAYDLLSEGMKTMLDGLRAIHSGTGLASASGKRDAWKEHGQDHPVVRTHPETGRKALYVSPAFTVALEDMTLEESRPLLGYLNEAGHAPDVCYRHRWQTGDLVLWDNRSVQHYAVHDHGKAERTMHRITIMGDTPR